MKKCTAIVALLAYFVLSCGFTVNAHFCMDRLASVHFFGEKADRCGKCGMDIHKSDGCCRDEVSVVKLSQDEVKIPVLSFELPSVSHPAILPSVFIESPLLTALADRHFLNHSPPLLSFQDTYLLNGVFRI
jgi:hypothetical protein